MDDSVSQEGRRHYRLESSQLGDLTTTLLFPDLQVKAAKLMNLSVNGAMIAFPAATCPDLLPGQTQKLEITDSGNRTRIEIDAKVIERQHREHLKLFRFSFANFQEIFPRLNPTLQKCFNRRQAFRAAPDEDKPIQVDIEWEEGRVQGRMLDISTGGIGILVNPDVAERLAQPEWVGVTFLLPDIETPFYFKGTVCYRRAKDGLYHYGVRFDWTQTENVYRFESGISAYVTKRQQEMIKGAPEHFLPIGDLKTHDYTRFALYLKIEEDKFTLYKSAGRPLGDLGQTLREHPPLYMREADKVTTIREQQNRLHQKLKSKISLGVLIDVKETLRDIVAEAFAVPKKESLALLIETVDILVDGYASAPETMKALAQIAIKEHTNDVHSVNVMLLTFGFVFYAQYPLDEVKQFGMMALLHDVGRAVLPDTLFDMNRRLTSDEFKLYQTHSQEGYQIVQSAGRLAERMALGVLEHHERMDGSGYPHGKSELSFAGKLLSLIDCYEALTNDFRPYRRTKQPLETLKVLKDEMEAGKFDRKVFETFCYSLV